MKWEIDPFHSSVTFTIRHMMSKVRGQMKIKEGWLEGDTEHASEGSVEVVLDPATIDTGVEMRDNHLRSADGHFDVANYPTITFKSRRIDGTDRSNFQVVGDLTIHGVTKQVTLNAGYNGEGKDPYGNSRLSFTADTKLNRKDFGLTWNQALEAGNFLLGDDVRVDIDIEAVRAKTAAEGSSEIEAEALVESR